MRRQAILIGSDNAISSNPLHGASRDIDALESFLLSDAGGAWYGHEILTLPEPTLDQLQAVLENARARCDYLFIAIVGHGAYTLKGSFVQLNETEVVRIADLAHQGAQARRVLVLSGACRGQAPFPTTLRAAGVSEDVAGVPSTAYSEKCRAAFDYQVMEAKEGAAVMHSCSVGESAWYVRDRGGIFTQTLLRLAQTWASGLSNGVKPQKWRSAAKALAVASEPTAVTVLQYGHTQTPEIYPRPDPPAFPFVIA